MTTEPTWLQTMPRLLFDCGVPIVAIDGDGDPLDSGVVTHSEPGRVMVSWHDEHDEGSTEEGDGSSLRIDLEDPQGFSYALRLLMKRCANEERARREWPNAWRTVLAFWEDYGIVSGATVTDRDRVRLAEALREVFNG